MADDRDFPHDGVNMKSTDQDQVKQLKRRLEGWREIILPLNSLLLWEKTYYPGILSGVVTLIFLLVWYVEPAVLTGLSLLGIIVCVLDYAVPWVSASFFDHNKWTGTQERQFEDICQQLVKSRQQVSEQWHLFTAMRHTRPKVYLVTVLASLVMLAWIGNLVDNLVLTYLLVLLLVMIPGLHQHGILQKYVAKATLAISSALGQKKTN